MWIIGNLLLQELAQKLIDSHILGVAIVREHFFFAQEDDDMPGTVASPPASDSEGEDDGECAGLDAVLPFNDSNSDEFDDERIEPGSRIKVWEVVRLAATGRPGSQAHQEASMRIVQELEYLGSELDVIAIQFGVHHDDVGAWLNMPQSNTWTMAPQIIRSPLDQDLDEGLSLQQQRALHENLRYFNVTFSPLKRLMQLYVPPDIPGDAYGAPYRYQTGETNHMWVTQAYFLDDGLRNRKSTKTFRPKFDISGIDQRKQRKQRADAKKDLKKKLDQIQRRDAIEQKKHLLSKARLRKYSHSLPAGYRTMRGKEEMNYFVSTGAERAGTRHRHSASASGWTSMQDHESFEWFADGSRSHLGGRHQTNATLPGNRRV